MAGDNIFQYLTQRGAPSTFNAIGDYSGGATDFIYRAPDADKIGTSYIYRLLVYIEDSGNFAAGGYGAAAGLTNGIQVMVLDTDSTTVIQNLHDVLPVTSNARWAAKAHDVLPHTFGNGNNSQTVRWTFSASGIPLRLQPGQEFVVRLNDDFTGLVEHLFQVQGFLPFLVGF